MSRRVLSIVILGLLALIAAGCETTSTGAGPVGYEPVGNPDAAPFLPDSSVGYVLAPGGGTPDTAFNIVFVADEASYDGFDSDAEKQAFLADVGSVIENGFQQLSAIYRNPTLFHYYVLDVPGQIGAGDCPGSLNFPDEVIARDAAFADAFLMLHKDPAVRDCYNGHRRASTGVRDRGDGVMSIKYGTAVHEIAHALFNLPDEYAHNGGYWQTDPTGVLFESLSDCQAYVAAEVPALAGANCTPLPTNTGLLYRAEGFISDLMAPTSPFTVNQLGPADWLQFERVVGNVGSTVNPPDTFAPEPWSKP